LLSPLSVSSFTITFSELAGLRAGAETLKVRCRHVNGAYPHRKNSDDVALLPAREASARCPQVVIDFYEQKLSWHCGDEEQ